MNAFEFISKNLRAPIRVTFEAGGQQRGVIHADEVLFAADSQFGCVGILAGAKDQPKTFVHWNKVIMLESMVDGQTKEVVVARTGSSDGENLQ